MSEGRISRDEMFVQMVNSVSLRSTCLRRQVGAVLVIRGRPLSIGYAGSPSGTPHCTDVGCLIGDDGGCTRTIHAEVNAISWAARNGIAIEGSTLYCSLTPCLSCAKLIINSGIIRVVALEDYRDQSGAELLDSVGIEIEKIHYQSRGD